MSDIPTWIWGHKSIAIFDVWSIEHVLAGVSIGAFVIKASQYMHRRRGSSERATPGDKHIATVLLLAFCWETAEHYMELGLIGLAVADWFAGVEIWGNRMITDPLMVFLGYKVAYHRPHFVWPARVLSAAWLVVHVMVFPHSMYLHEPPATEVVQQSRSTAAVLSASGAFPITPTPLSRCEEKALAASARLGQPTSDPLHRVPALSPR